MKALVSDPEECDIEELTNLQSLPNSLAIFAVATYGEGDPTDNALELNEWLKNTTVDLTGLNYAVSLYYTFFWFYLEIYFLLQKKTRKSLGFARRHLNPSSFLTE